MCIQKYFLAGLILVIAACPLSARAQDEPNVSEEEDTLDLLQEDDTGGLMDEFAFLAEELTVDEVVSASKRRQPILLSPSAITVITREDILASGATTLPDLLRRVPNMDIYRLKPSYTLVGARARTNEYNNQVLLLIDGREELLELAGIALWNALSIDLEEIERIEVIRGPGSALYGANAVTAVVSVTTVAERPESGGAVMLSAGETGRSRLFGRMRDSLTVGDSLLSYNLGLGYEQEASPSDRRDRSIAVLRSHGHIRYQTPGGLDLSLHGGLVAGSMMFYLFTGDTSLEDMFMPWLMAQANYTASDNLQLKSQLYLHRMTGDIFPRADLRAYGMWIADLPELSWSSNTVDGQFQLEWKVVEGLLFTVGGNLRYSTLAGKNFILDNDDELRGAGVAHLEVNPWDFFMLTLGMRMDVSELTGIAPSPRVVVIIRPWPNQAFRLGYGLAFRKPSFLESRVHFNIDNFNSSMPEIVDKLATEFSNPELENVDTQSIELGWRASFLDAQLWLSVETFFNTYRKIIAFDTEIPFRLGMPDIHNGHLLFTNEDDEFTIIGGEAEVSYKPSPGWSFTCNVGVRSTESKADREGFNKEPLLRAGFGGRFTQPEGIIADVFLHFITDYQQVLLDPEDILRSIPLRGHMGEQMLLVSRLAYRAKRSWFSFETGLTIRAPLLEKRHEFPGLPIPPHLGGGSASDFGGEILLRQLSVYLRGLF